MMKLLTLKDVSKVLGGRSRTTIYRDISEGRLPIPIKIGGRLYWVEDQLREFILGADHDR